MLTYFRCDTFRPFYSRGPSVWHRIPKERVSHGCKKTLLAGFIFGEDVLAIRIFFKTCPPRSECASGPAHQSNRRASHTHLYRRPPLAALRCSPTPTQQKDRSHALQHLFLQVVFGRRHRQLVPATNTDVELHNMHFFKHRGLKG